MPLKFLYHGELSAIPQIPTWEWEPEPGYPFDLLVGSQFASVHYAEAQYAVGKEPQRMSWDPISEACALITGHPTAERYVSEPCYLSGSPACYVKSEIAPYVRMALHSKLREGLVKAFYKIDKEEYEEANDIIYETELSLEQISNDFISGAERIEWYLSVSPDDRGYVVEVEIW